MKITMEVYIDKNENDSFSFPGSVLNTEELVPDGKEMIMDDLISEAIYLVSNLPDGYYKAFVTGEWTPNNLCSFYDDDPWKDFDISVHQINIIDKKEYLNALADNGKEFESKFDMTYDACEYATFATPNSPSPFLPGAFAMTIHSTQATDRNKTNNIMNNEIER